MGMRRLIALLRKGRTFSLFLLLLLDEMHEAGFLP